MITHSDPDPLLVGHSLPVPLPLKNLKDLVTAGPVRQLRAIYTPGGGTYGVTQPLLLAGGSAFGAIHVGVSTLLIRGQLNEAISNLKWPIIGVLAVTVFVAMLLANVILRMATRQHQS